MISKNPKDLYSGLLFSSIGLGFFVYSTFYPMGSLSQMGPAYFPMILSCLLLTLGITTIATAQPDPDPLTVDDPAKMLVISASVFVFSMALSSAGFVIAAMASILIAMVGVGNITTKQALPAASGIIATCVVIFILLLEISIPILPPVLFR